MSCRPKISLIIPIYNVEDYIDRCLGSVVHQTLMDIEIICVDDGTKDDSCEIVEAYQKQDNRIKLVHKENGGLSSARNVGLDHATGDYIWFIDSDDYIVPNACARIYREILERRPDIIGFGAEIVPEIPQADPWTWAVLSPETHLFLSKKANIHSSLGNAYKKSVNALIDYPGTCPFVWRACFKHSFLKKYNFRFDENTKFGEDTIFFFDIYPYARQAVIISDKLYVYRHYRKGSLMYKTMQDEYQHLNDQLDIAELVVRRWKDKNFIPDQDGELIKWYARFLTSDLLHYKGSEKNAFCKRYVEIAEQAGLDKKLNKLSPKEFVKFNIIKVLGNNAN